jgi:solute carrier family 35 protein C2
LQNWEQRDEEGYSTEGSSAFLSEDEEMEPAAASSRRKSVEHSGHGGASRDGKLVDDRRESGDHQADVGSEDEGINDDEETGLTGQDKRRRENRRTDNARFDQRITGNSGGFATAQEKKDADQHVVKRMLINGLLIGLWYVECVLVSVAEAYIARYLFSLSISIYNKWMFDPKHLDFHFPLFTTSMHMVVQFALASLALFIFPRFRPRYDSISNPKNRQTEESRIQHEAEEKKPLMTWWFYASRLGPCGLATGLDIGLGNMSLKFISLTFYSASILLHI